MRSSSSNADNPNNAWNVNFNNGNVNNNDKSNDDHVRAVRAGKCALLSFESVYHAYLDCRRRKRGTINALRFEYDLIGNITNLAFNLQKGTYRPSRSVCFITRSPKPREIFAADFRDRVIHHLVVRAVEPFWEARFIHDSYACRLRKGTHAGVRRLRSFMRKATRNGNRPAWYLQIDVRSFFMSIEKARLYAILESKTPAGPLPELLARIIFHDPTTDYRFKGNPALLSIIPPHKSLFHVGPERGLPIGNLTSQFFANVYLNELDQFVKQTLKCRFYIRYVDDAVLVDPDPDRLLRWRDRIAGFLEARLALALKDPGKLRRVTEGADFLGYIVRPNYLLVRRRVVNNLKYKLALIRDELVREMWFGRLRVRRTVLPPERVKWLRQVVCSYISHFKHANAYHLIRSIFDRRDWLREILEWRGGKVRDRLKPRRGYRFLKSQVGFFKSRLPDCVCFIRMGRYFELYGEDALLMNAILGFQLRRGVRGMGYACGFKAHKLPLFNRLVLRAGYDTAVIEESGAGRYVRDRYVQAVYRRRGYGERTFEVSKTAEVLGGP